MSDDSTPELAAGERPSRESVTVARDRAAESLRRAQEAHHAAMEGHDSSARLQQPADRHRQAAHDSHLDALQDEARSQDPAKSSPGQPAHQGSKDS
jgi:hypothetical protein